MTGTENARAKRAVVILTNTWPDPGGVGAVSRFRMLESFSDRFPALRDCDMYGLFGEWLVPLRGADDAGRVLAEPRRSRFSRPPRALTRPAKWIVQSQIIRNLAQRHEATVVLAQEPFYANRLAKHRRLFVVQVEPSKGGMHTEYLAIHRKQDLRYRLTKALIIDTLGGADWVVFPSRGAASLYANSNPTLEISDKVRIVYNGVMDPADSVKPANTDSLKPGIVVCNVAHHVPEKAIDFTIQGIALWKARTKSPPAIRMINCGGFSPETQKLRDMASDRSVDIEFLGSVSRDVVLDVMTKSDVFALTPSVAVFDLALLEAMGLAKPIISTPVGGNREALGDGYEGYAQDPKDFAEKLDLILSDEPFAARLRNWNRERFVRQFRCESMVESYVEILDEAFAVVEKRFAKRNSDHN